jgi:hypothetical protein
MVSENFSFDKDTVHGLHKKYFITKYKHQKILLKRVIERRGRQWGEGSRDRKRVEWCKNLNGNNRYNEVLTDKKDQDGGRP